MDYQNFENLNFLVNNEKDQNNLSMNPVLIDRSTNPLYLIDRRNLIAFKQLLLNVDQLNQLSQLNKQPFNRIRANKSELESVPKTYRKTIDKNFIISKSFLVNDDEIKSSKSITNPLKKIGIKISRFLSFSKSQPKSDTETESESSLEYDRPYSTVDDETLANEQIVNGEIKDDLVDADDIDGSNDDLIDDLDDYDAINSKNTKSRLKNKFSSYKELIKSRILKRVDEDDDESENELNQIYKLARFIEKNLKVIGLDQIEQLFAFNKTLTFKNAKNLNNLIKQINSKLEEDGDLFNMLTRIDRSNSDKIKRLDDEDSLNSLDLFREFEDYLKQKRKELRKRKRNVIKKLNEDHDYIISSINNKKNNLLKKSRKRRSRKMKNRRKPLNRSKGKFNRSKFKEQNRQIRKLDRYGRTSKSKLNYDKTNFRNCERNDEECGEESEIHEQFVPFNKDDQQTSESYESNNQQDNQDEYRNENNQNENYDNQQDYNQQQNYNEPDYDQQQSNYRPQDLRLKSNVKYEDSSNDQYESGQQNDNYSANNSPNYESQPETSYSEQASQMDEYTGNDDLPPNQMLDDGEELNYYRHPHNHHYISNYYEHPTQTEHPLISLKRLKLKHLNKHFHPHAPDNHHLENGPPHLGPPPHPHHSHHPHGAHPEPHPKDDLTLTKELITNLLVQNKHKIFAILKATKLSHLFISKQVIAVALQVFFGKSVYAKKKLILAAYKKCYIKIRTIDMLLIPVGVGK